MPKYPAKRRVLRKKLPQVSPQPTRAMRIDLDPSKLTDIVRAVVLELAESLPDQGTPDQIEAARERRGRQHAVRLRDRMKKFAAVYNTAWFVRHSEVQAREYREQKMRAFWAACRQELEACEDIEAFTYAVADALTAYRYGFPWEG
ncbi:MAG: hypothetical protein HY322_04505 [Betaproteobacteria bacterium]|nr:hypothetical protein [Betaproteobacteria bacterium]